jgi:hypothetical protein
MRTRSTAVLLTVNMFVAPSLAGCGVATLFAGCSERDEHLADVINQDAILAVHPTAATQVRAYADCDNDDGFAFAGREFRTDLARERSNIVVFYQQAGPKAGWTVTLQSPPARLDAPVVSPGFECYSRQIDGVAVHLLMSFPSDFNNSSTSDSQQYPADTFVIELRGSHASDVGC